MSALLERVRAAGREAPEDSVALRLVVGVMVEVAILAVVVQGGVEPTTAVVALLAAPLGYISSYRHRNRPAVGTKVVLALGLLVALGVFLEGVRGVGSFDEVRRPLAGLFLWVQVLHAFDVPRRRDLAFSTVSSLILIAQGATLSFGAGYLVFLLPWLALAGAWMFLTLRPPAAETAAVRLVRVATPGRGRRRALARSTLVTISVVFVAVLMVFLALPRLPGANVALPPFGAPDRAAIMGFDGSVMNPGLEIGDDGVPAFSDAAYPGFGDVLDLRSRGRLSDRIAFRVRSPQPALWRGQVFDTFDGARWTASDRDVIAMRPSWDRSVELPTLADETIGGVATRRVVATFYVAEPQPNVIFAPYLPSEVYFPASVVTDRYASLRASIFLDAGVVYSVVSVLPSPSPALLRASPAVWDQRAAARYLQLPSGLPARVRALAQRITGGRPSVYDRVLAVEAWLRANTTYDLSVPAGPPDVDLVDHFLFETRRGYCEHIASAMVVLLRSAGIPSRIVTGFGPGGRNAFTGYYDVRESDAHAWVEVWYANVGWIAYDPTFGVPAVDPGWWDRFVAPEVLRQIGRFLAGAVPEPVRHVVGALGHAVASAASVAADAWPIVAALTIVGALVVTGVRRRRRRRARGPAPVGATLAFVALEEAMRARGHPRREPQTPDEFLVELPLDPVERAEAELVVRAFERERFAATGPSEVETRAAIEAARRVAARTPAGVRPRRHARAGSPPGAGRKRISAESHTRS